METFRKYDHIMHYENTNGRIGNHESITDKH